MTENNSNQIQSKMKANRLILGLAVLALPLMLAFAGKDPVFKTVWEGSLDNKGSLYANASPDGDRVVGSTRTEFCLMDGKTGKLLYSKKFKDVSDGELSNTNYQIIMWEANAMLVFDNKLGKDRIAAIDLKDGKMLWIKDRFSFPKPKEDASGNAPQLEDMIVYIEETRTFAFAQKEALVMIELMTGKEIWETTRFRGSVGQYIYLPETNELVMVNFQPKGLLALFSGFKNQLMRINAGNGEVAWEATYRGVVEKTVLTRDPLVKLSINKNKLFLQLGGLQVYDLASGKEIWGAYYQPDLGGFKRSGTGKNLRAGIYGAIADPLVTNDAVYIVLGDDKLKNKFVQKFDLETGKELWTSEKIKDATAIPNLQISGNTLVMQLGGYVNQQRITREGNPQDGYTIYYVNEYIWLPKFGIAGIDINTGQYIWRSEKFKKRITDIVVDNGKVYAASGEYFYCYDAPTGRELYATDLTKAKVGPGLFAFDMDDKVAIVGDKGMAAFSKADGKMEYSTEKFKGVMSYVRKGDNVFLQNEKYDIAGIDLKNGEIKGIVNIKPSKHTENEAFANDSEFSGGVDMTIDGEYIYAFRKEEVTKLKVN